MFTLLLFALACSSGGSGNIVIDGNGNTSGYWQFVMDDNGYLTRIWVDIKPGDIYSDSNGNLYSQDSFMGYISDSKAALLIDDEYCFFEVTWIDENYCELSSESLPVIHAFKTTILEAP